ncbi:hypothetical protein [Limnoglobus roseus]|uniref:Uncharacterized protein n=1 Tax=Limnoglobus roseus TaxID=2598579 RepID=A0A5C1AL05_9BACT|nr:hypothetical protein [Limnoglobus roseus]QEL18867.1 hypothetical protein PX52LOC_05909 [Limnoglobus roseus]
MTPTLTTLREAVLLHPADDVVRGVFADACLESGDETTVAHGELILLQLAWADEERPCELIRRWPSIWSPGVPLLTGGHRAGEWWRVNDGVAVAITRGFVSAVQLTDPTARMSTAPWSETTVAAVADAHARAVATLFAAHPLERVVIDFGRAAETWGIEQARQEAGGVHFWWCRRPAEELTFCWTPRGRDVFSDSLRKVLRDFLVALGQHVVHVQRRERTP